MSAELITDGADSTEHVLPPPPPPGWPDENTLARVHRQQLIGSAISPEVAVARGYRTKLRPGPNDESLDTELKRAGIPKWGRDRKNASLWPALVIPTYSTTGAFDGIQVRLLTAQKGTDGKTRKYALPRGKSQSLDVHPFNRNKVADPTEPLFITEGVKKADALTSRGKCAVAVNGVYGWRNTAGAEAVWEDIPLRGREVILVFDSDTNERRDLQRAINRLGAWLTRKGAKVTYLVIPDAMPAGKTGIDDWFADGHDLSELERVATVTPPMVDEKGEFTDAKLADRFADTVLDGEFLFTKELGWLHWDGKRWIECGEELVLNEIRLAAVDEFNRMLDTAKDKPDKLAVATEFKKVLSANRLTSILKLCRGHSSILCDVGEFDAHPHLLNVGNGIIDLRDGELYAHAPEARLTKITQVDYDPEAQSPLWDAALEALPEGAIRDWAKDRLGQAATGDMVPDDRLVMILGGGSNGKSLLMNTCRRALGGHAVLVPHRALLGSADSHTTELTELRGARLALVEELPEGRHLNVTRLKMTVGTPEMTARRMYKDTIAWAATHSLFVNSNYRPDISEVDEGTWRRLAILRFPFHFVPAGEPHTQENDRDGDPQLREKILRAPDALSAALAWLVDGAREYFERGRIMAPIPREAMQEIDEWRDDADRLGAFLRDSLVRAPDRYVRIDELCAQYNEWGEGRGFNKVSMTTFSGRLLGHPMVTELRLRKARVRSSTDGISNPVMRSIPSTPGQLTVLRGVRFVHEGAAELGLRAAG